MRAIVVAGVMVVAGSLAAAQSPKKILDDALEPKGDFGISVKSFLAAVAKDEALYLRAGECGVNGGRQFCMVQRPGTPTKIFAYQDQVGRVTQVAIALPAAEWAEGGALVDAVQRHLFVAPQNRISGSGLTKSAQTIPGVPFPDGNAAIACFGLVPKAGEAQVVCSAR